MPSARPAHQALLTDHLRHWARHRPQQRALTHVDFPAPDSPGAHRTLGWRALDARARAVAGRLAAAGASPGDRAALLLPQGLDYAAAFLGCLYARVIAVPLFGPQLPGHEGRLAAVLADCEPSCLLSDTGTADPVRDFLRDYGLPEPPVVPVDRLPVGRLPVDRFPGDRLPVDRLPGDRTPSVSPDPGHDAQDAPADPSVSADPAPDPDDIAYLQYTSGSTRTPAGVMISHANVVANAHQAIEAFVADPRTATTVGWLPLFHDMGLVLSIAAPVVGGFPSVLMDPVAFLEDPSRWLRLLGSYEGTISAAPNFAYDYCVARTDPDLADELALDRVRVLINGSEPVRTGTVERFQAAFGPAGLDPVAHCPAYGLAEATVFVTADSRTAPPTPVPCDPDALAAGRVEESADPGATVLVSCGAPVGQEVRITGPDGSELPEGHVGEIRLRGPNIGLGYWKRDADDTFGGPEGWLRTGDLGALHDGRLLVTGRLKDLLVVDGRNHYPQDVEETVQTALPMIRRDRLAAFGVPRPDDTGEELVVVAEHRRDTSPTPRERREAEVRVRGAVSARHGLRLGALVLVPPGAVPRTSSGKVARAASRARFLDGGFGPR
jgi:acyl-CoA synthetase (AMP-forming)/AMP-acid ligase II